MELVLEESKNQDNKTSFSSLSVGEVFREAENHYLEIKLDGMYSLVIDDIHGPEEIFLVPHERDPEEQGVEVESVGELTKLIINKW